MRVLRFEDGMGHRLVVRRVCVTQTRKHVCDGVCHCHWGYMPFPAVVSPTHMW
jgi:hypothetical protein